MGDNICPNCKEYTMDLEYQGGLFTFMFKKITVYRLYCYNCKHEIIIKKEGRKYEL